MRSDALPHRRSFRIPRFDYSGPGVYFVTIVAHGRACRFGHIIKNALQLSAQGRVAEECWRQIPAHFPNVELGAFIIMPNHVHGILALHDREDKTSSRRGTPWRAPTPDAHPLERFGGPISGSLATIMRQYKPSVTRRINGTIGVSGHIWQRGYYEHVIRNDEDWNRIHPYIESNVVNWAQDEENAGRREVE